MTRTFREASPLARSGKPKRAPRPEIVIVCEGKVTEPRYFQDFSSIFSNSLVTITPIGGCGVPTSVVERAIQEKTTRVALSRKTKDSFDSIFEVWAVFDRDSHPMGQVPTAIDLANKNGICIGYSNPCFEVWGLMHFSCYAKPGHHHETQSDLKRALPDYCHEKNPIFNVTALKDRYRNAVINAKRAASDRETEGNSIFGDPSTTIYQLTERIVFFGKK